MEAEWWSGCGHGLKGSSPHLGPVPWVHGPSWAWLLLCLTGRQHRPPPCPRALWDVHGTLYFKHLAYFVPGLGQMLKIQGPVDVPQQSRASLLAQTVKRLSTTRETWVRSLGWEDPLEKEMATHSSILAWKIPWTEEPGRPWSPWGHEESDAAERLHSLWYKVSDFKVGLLLSFCSC